MNAQGPSWITRGASTRHTLPGLALALLCASVALNAAQKQDAPQDTRAGSTPKPVQKIDAAVNPDATALVDFKRRVDAYVALHRKVAKSVPPLKETTNPAEITRAQAALEQALSTARADAKAGDIFTPQVRAAFRKILMPELKGEDGRDAKEIIKDDAPAPLPLKVNAKYPENATRPTVPAAILANLPKLPEEVEYRIVGRHLVLLDTEAAMIVDFIPNAITL